jgi:hypothetical protein
MDGRSVRDDTRNGNSARSRRTNRFPVRFVRMGIVPFPGQDWTADERAEIGRLEKVCEASDGWTLECSHTDAGDPWCIVYDRYDYRIVLHIARINREYVLVWPCEQRSTKTAIMAVAIEGALEGLKSRMRRAS